MDLLKTGSLKTMLVLQQRMHRKTDGPADLCNDDEKFAMKKRSLTTDTYWPQHWYTSQLHDSLQ